MPNKTIYVSDADLPLYQRAQELVGGNLSAAITRALRRLVEVEESKLEGFDEVVVPVGPGPGRRQRFLGVLLVDWSRSTKDRVEQYRVYLSRGGKYVLHVQRSEEHIWRAGPDGATTGWRKHFATDQVWATKPASATLEVVDSPEDLRGKAPDDVVELVIAAADQPVVEDLDI